LLSFSLGTPYFGHDLRSIAYLGLRTSISLSTWTVNDINLRDRVFEEWSEAPVDCTSKDPRFEVRRATPSDFDRIFDLVDTVFETKRGRAAYEWLYRENPLGLARCWLVIERSSAALVATQCRFPWPIALGSERLEGEFGGDLATLPRLQRQGLFQLRNEISDLHPAQRRIVTLAAPNPKTRGAAKKLGRQNTILGPLPFARIPLDFEKVFDSRSWPRGPSKILGAAANKALGFWHNMALASADGVRIEELGRFDSDIDSLTYRCMMTPTYWCPHEAEFLNWRYLQHPVNSYIAQAAIIGDEVRGYSVVRINEARATLMEFVASEEQPRLAAALLHSAVRLARDAGCQTLSFFATPTWRFWGLFRRAGFINGRSEIYLTARCAERADVSQEENWQLLPGDRDVG